MKRLVSVLIAALPVIAFAQDGKYIVEGTVGTYNAPAKVYLQADIKGKTFTDSVTLKDGKFQFTGSIGNDPVVGYLTFNDKGTGIISYKDYIAIYLEKGTITLTSSDQLKNSKVVAPKMDKLRYDATLKEISDQRDALDKELKAATTGRKDSIGTEIENREAVKKLAIKENEIHIRFIKDNPDSYISLNALEAYANSNNADYADIAPLYNGLSDAVKQSEAGKQFGARLPKLKSVAIGAVAPEFAEADTSVKIISLSSFRGQYVLIDFWASWCDPCRRENPYIVKTFNYFKGKNFTILSVSLDKPGTKDKWLAAIHKDGLIWTHVSDLQYWKSKAADLYGVRVIPQNFLIDPNGKIIRKNLMGFELFDILRNIFFPSEAVPD